MVKKQTIGELNGWRAGLFTILLPVITALIPVSVGWGVWVTKGMLKNRQILYEIQLTSKLNYTDRFTSNMYIEAQDELKDQNPDIHWLSAAEVRSIQLHNPPYSNE